MRTPSPGTSAPPLLQKRGVLPCTPDFGLEAATISGEAALRRSNRDSLLSPKGCWEYPQNVPVTLDARIGQCLLLVLHPFYDLD